MIELVAERGYRAVTVRDLVRVAGVSTRTFYKQFAGKEECFLATFDLVVARAMRRVVAAQRGCEDWRERWRRAFAAFVRDPAAARLAFVHAYEAGEPAFARMRCARAAFEAMIADGFEQAPGGVALSPPPLLVKGIAAGVERVARARVLAGREAELPGVADELERWALCYRHPAVAALADQTCCARRDPPVVAGWLRVIGGETENTRQSPQVAERMRILEAAAQLAASEGYQSLTVPRVRAAAGVSRKCFDAHFADVHECFSGTLEHLAGRALGHAVRACATAGAEWPVNVYRTLGALLECFAHDPVLARVAFVEVSTAGLSGMRCRARIVAEIARILRDSAPACARPSELAAEASVGAVWWILHEQVVAGRTCTLPTCTGVLSFLLLAPAVGAQPAIAAITGRAAARESEPSYIVQAQGPSPHPDTGYPDKP